MFEAFSACVRVVFLGEMGDKTQLLALLIAARYRAPVPIILGIVVATLANHLAANALGAWLVDVLNPEWLRWGLGTSLIALAAWMLVPDEADDATATGTTRWGVFGITVGTYFIAEMGDKTQAATLMLAAKYHSLPWVLAGSTVGMLLADAPAALFGDKVVKWVPLVWVNRIAATVFSVMGLLLLLGVGA